MRPRQCGAVFLERWRRFWWFVLPACGPCLLATGAANVEEPPGAGSAESESVFGEAVQVLRSNCFGCHNPEKDRGGLILTSREGLLSGADSGSVVVPGDPNASRMIGVLAASAEPHMPPKKMLSAREIDVLGRWVASGLQWDEGVFSRMNGPRDVRLEAMPDDYRPVQALAFDPMAKRVAWARGADLLIQDLGSTNNLPPLRITAHKDIVRSVAWSPDGNWVATGGFREVTVWNSTNLTIGWSSRTNLLGRILALEFTPYGGALVVGEGAVAESGWVRVLEASSGREMSAWRAHSDTVSDVAISPDGGLLATAGSDKLVKTWEILTQTEVARFEGHSGAVLGVAFNPAGGELISVGADRQLRLWDVRNREAVVTLSGRKHTLNAVSWSADGSRVASVDEDGRLYGFTDFKRHTGEQSSATAKEKSLGKWTNSLHTVAISGDGKTVARVVKTAWCDLWIPKGSSWRPWLHPTSPANRMS